jgi:transcriptional regulator with XRE-family HTH domain
MAGYGFEVSKSTISHWEIGRNRLPLDDPQFRTAMALALELDVAMMLNQLGYEVSSENRSDEARLAADIVDQLPKDAKVLAIDYLKLLQARFSGEGQRVG